MCDYEIVNQFKGDTHNLVTRLLAEEFAKSQVSLSFIMGMDNANTCSTQGSNPKPWVNWDDLERMIPFVVVPRAGVKPDPKVDWYKKPPHIDLSRCERTIRDTASSEVRRIIREKRDEQKLADLMDPKVMEFLKEVRSYREGYRRVVVGSSTSGKTVVKKKKKQR